MSYSSEVLGDSPQGYWRCGDGSGTLTDAVGANHLDSITGSITYGSTGLIASDSGNTSITVTSARASKSGYTASATLPFTIEAWLKPSAVGGGTYRYAIANNNDGAASGWRCGTNGSGAWHISYRAVADYDFSATASVNTAYHVVFVCKTDQDVDLYLNGSFSQTVAGSASPGTTLLDFHIGASPGGALPWAGVIDEVAFYTSALSSGRIAAHYVLATSQIVVPDADIDAGSWTTTPLWSKVNDSSDATVITATAS